MFSSSDESPTALSWFTSDMYTASDTAPLLLFTYILKKRVYVNVAICVSINLVLRFTC